MGAHEWQEFGWYGWSTVDGGGVERSEAREMSRARLGRALRELPIILNAVHSHSKFTSRMIGAELGFREVIPDTRLSGSG